jgi:hypothetical protein
MRQAKVAPNVRKANGTGAPCANICQSPLGKTKILKVADVFDNRLLEVRFLAAPSRLGERVETLLDVIGEFNS